LQGVTLRLADGSAAQGDVLIGADGIKSVVRAQIHGEVPASYTGFVAWRLTVPREKLPAGVMDLIGTVWCGPKNHCVLYWLRRGEILNFVGCPRRAVGGGILDTAAALGGAEGGLRRLAPEHPGDPRCG
jgi:salicylate hydroxylase